MGIVTKVEPIDRDLLLSFGGDLSEKGRSAALAAFAIEERDKAVDLNRASAGQSVTYETYVDGKQGAGEASVRPDGVISYEFGLVRPVLEWIGNELVMASPVLTGRYARSHVLFADGREVEHMDEAPDAQRFVFLNIQPYARKIEDGLSPQATEGVYQGVASVAQARFGNAAKIFFGWEATVFASAKATPAERRASAATRVPAIIVRLY